uniref:Uncharacterized protein n=1 Tax=Myotis myotis TaxID=51298 RepID=A0A7J7Y195_MYOMY|nr:hypothetical protein mMyoMyo1_011506 [Myotis myotis]
MGMGVGGSADGFVRLETTRGVRVGREDWLLHWRNSAGGTGRGSAARTDGVRKAEDKVPKGRRLGGGDTAAPWKGAPAEGTSYAKARRLVGRRGGRPVWQLEGRGWEGAVQRCGGTWRVSQIPPEASLLHPTTLPACGRRGQGGTGKAEEG